MKKTNYLVGIVLGALLLAGFSCNGGDENKQDAQEATETQQEAVEESNGTIKDFENALTRNQKMKCTYRVDEGGQSYENTMYVQGDKYRTEYSTEGIEYNTVFDGETMHTWDEKTGQGTKMDIECLEDLETAQEADSVEDDQYEEYESSQEILDTGVDVSCRQVDSIDFSVPSNVEFVDQCKMLKEQLEALEDLESQMPNVDDLNIPEY